MKMKIRKNLTNHYLIIVVPIVQKRSILHTLLRYSFICHDKPRAFTYFKPTSPFHQYLQYQKLSSIPMNLSTSAHPTTRDSPCNHRREHPKNTEPPSSVGTENNQKMLAAATARNANEYERDLGASHTKLFRRIKVGSHQPRTRGKTNSGLDIWTSAPIVVRQPCGTGTSAGKSERSVAWFFCQMFTARARAFTNGKAFPGLFLRFIKTSTIPGNAISARRGSGDRVFALWSYAYVARDDSRFASWFRGFFERSQEGLVFGNVTDVYKQYCYNYLFK